jgi:hypothetical protein
MIFAEKSRKLLQTGSDRITAMVNFRPVGPKLKWAILMSFDEKTRKLPKPEVTVFRQR